MLIWARLLLALTLMAAFWRPFRLIALFQLSTPYPMPALDVRSGWYEKCPLSTAQEVVLNLPDVREVCRFSVA